MICRRCRAQLPESATYCHECAFTGPDFHWAAAATDAVSWGEVPPPARKPGS